VKYQRFFAKAMPMLIAACFLSCAAACFGMKYGLAVRMANPFHWRAAGVNRYLFALNFYFSIAVCFAGICGFAVMEGNSVIRRWIFLLVAFAGSVTGGYVLNDFFTINLCFYSAVIAVAILVFAFPVNLYAGGALIACYVFFLFHPYYMTPVWAGNYHIPEPEQIALLVLIMVLFAGVTAAIRFLLDKLSDARATIDHLNQVGTQMLEFNHRLQEYVRNTGEEAVKKDRLRFTSDLHDACGYVFTNIIAVSEAAISWSYPDFQKMRETFKLVQKQAQDGLKRTRETLYAIRELREPESGSIETIFEMKSILEKITDIEIIIETGNIRRNYGPDINRMLTRIVQEAFTNSVRHGKATRITIGLWELENSLEMTVRDNGIGAQHIVKGIGLAGMEERVNRVGGSLEVFSPEDGGFCLKVSIPLLKEKEDA